MKRKRENKKTIDVKTVIILAKNRREKNESMQNMWGRKKLYDVLGN
jgi:hypothetical protein